MCNTIVQKRNCGKMSAYCINLYWLNGIRSVFDLRVVKYRCLANWEIAIIISGVALFALLMFVVIMLLTGTFKKRKSQQAENGKPRKTNRLTQSFPNGANP